MREFVEIDEPFCNNVSESMLTMKLPLMYWLESDLALKTYNNLFKK